MQPTLEDVARVAGVSRATASRVVRDAGPASKKARAAVAEAVKQLGYVPNLAARTLVTKQYDVVALVVPEPNQRIFTDPFFGSAIAGMVDALSATHKQLVLAMRTPADDDGDSLRRYLRESPVDGVVVLSHHTSDHFTGILQDRGIPMVFVGRPSEEPYPPYVDVDNEEGGRLAARHLIERGATRLATISGPQDMTAAEDRLVGRRRELAEQGIEEVAWYEGDFTGQTASQLTERLLEEHPDVDGLFVASDPMAMAALRALERRGVRVPNDIRVVGFDDTEAGRESTPSLTEITNPAQRMANLATHQLLEMISGAAPGEPLIVEPELVVRQSS